MLGSLGSYSDCLGVWTDICWGPVAQTLDVQCSPIAGFLLGICDTVEHHPQGMRKVYRYASACWRADAEVGRVDSIDRSEIFHR